MIGYINGRVIDVNNSSTIVLVGGIGYKVQCAEVLLIDTNVELWIEATYKEGEPTFWGFINKEQKYIFLELLKVNGIGPKTAFGLIAKIGVLNIVSAIQESNYALLKSGGVGDKLAQKLVIDLKDKIVSFAASGSTPANSSINMQELKDALSSLGMSAKELNAKISTLDFSTILTIEDAIKIVLKK